MWMPVRAQRDPGASSSKWPPYSVLRCAEAALSEAETQLLQSVRVRGATERELEALCAVFFKYAAPLIALKFRHIYATLLTDPADASHSGIRAKRCIGVSTAFDP